ANRNRAEIERLIGFFVNTLVLRTDLSGDPTFRELLGQVKGVALGAYANQDLPFEKLVEELQPERSLSHNPLFQVLFALQNVPRVAAQPSHVTMRVWGVDSGRTRFDLEVHMSDRTDGLGCAFVYSTDLFDASTIERMMGHFQVLLEAVAADPARRLSELPVLTAAERRRLVREWNDTRADVPDGQTVCAMFQAQVGRTPDAVALECGSRRGGGADLDHQTHP